MNDIVNPEAHALPEVYGAEGDSAVAVRLARVEIDTHIATARAYPRSMARAMKEVFDLVNLDQESASECIYALPRGGKPIKGPSVRFAEIVASAWGNCHVGSRVVAVDLQDKVVIAEGVFWDLQSGLKRVAQVRRRITDRGGKLFNEDMIVVTGNAACSIAMREAVLKGVPKAIWRRAYEQAERVTNGDVKTLVERRDEAVKAFAAYGVTPELIFEALEVGGPEDIGLDEIGTLRSMLRSIRSEEATVESYFPNLGKAGAGANRKPPPEPKGQGAAPRAEPKANGSAERPAKAAPAAEGRLPLDAPADKAPAPTPARRKELVALVDKIAGNAEVNAVQARAHHAADLETLRKEAPDLAEEAERELSDFAKAQAAREPEE